LLKIVLGRRLHLLFAAGAVALGLVPSAQARVGMLTQLPGKAGCLTQARERGCAVGRFGGNQMWALAASPDGRNLYVASLGGAVSVLAIDHRGHLHQLRGKAGCVSRSSRFGCRRVPQLSAGNDIAVSPDGRSVYVGTNGGIVIFSRSPRTGALRKTGCVGGKTCAPVRGVLGSVNELLVSPDGRTVYAASSDRNAGAVAVFERAPSGKLTQLDLTVGCLSADGSDGCAPVRELLPYCCGMALSPDSHNLYVSSSLSTKDSETFGLATYSREPTVGALTQLPGDEGCLNQDGSNGCAAVAFRGTAPNNEAEDIVISPNGRDLYLTHESIFEGAEGALCGAEDDFLALFHRGAGGALGPLVRDIGTCGASGLVMSPDGRTVYTLAGGFGDVVSLYARNRRTGLLSEAGCVGPFDKTCKRTRHFDGPSEMVLTRRFAYIIADDPGDGVKLAAFRRGLR
jgi:DNA-binding beta-propeller fold protein YncE